MSGFGVLRLAAAGCEVLAELIAAYRELDLTDPASITRFESAATAGEDILEHLNNPTQHTADEGPPAAAPDSAGAPEPAHTKPARTHAREAAARRAAPTPPGDRPAGDAATKHCPDCDTVKAAADFGRHAMTADGLQPRCRDCNGAAMRERHSRRNDVPAGQKRCSKCKAVKPVAEFGKDRARSDGLAYRCRDCHRAGARVSYRRTHATTGDDDQEGSQVAPTATLVRPTPAAPPDERVCAGCAKSLPLTSFRVKPTGRAKKCFVCDGSENAPLAGPDPLPGRAEFTVTITCSGCSLDETSKHPRADDPQLIAETLRRVDQALHDDCAGTLAAAVGPAPVEPSESRRLTPHRPHLLDSIGAVA